MMAPNHIAGGFTFTGILASIGGINILQDHRLLPVIFVASILPDIDHTKSLIGKLFLPISKAINRRFGHRTITHSLPAWIILTSLISGFQSAYFPNLKVAQVFSIAYASHLIFDMMTVQGVPLFFPFRKNPCVIPGNPEMRIRSNSLRQESMVFCVFIMSAIFLQPLFANGFWTSYNRLFGSLKHIVSEYHKSDDVLLVSFMLQHGTSRTKMHGLCIAVDPKSITILNNKGELETYPKEGQTVSDLYPLHTGSRLEFIQANFADISIDSFYIIFNDNKFSKIEIYANSSFKTKSNGKENSIQSLMLDFPNSILLESHVTPLIAEYISNPAIVTKESEINTIQNIYNQDVNEFNSQLQEYNNLKNLMESEEDEVKKELLMIGFASIKLPKYPTTVEKKIASLKATIKQMQAEDYIAYKKEIKKHQSNPLLLSGSYEKILIDGKPIGPEFDFSAYAHYVNQFPHE